jgi:hypothetical protein
MLATGRSDDELGNAYPGGWPKSHFHASLLDAKLNLVRRFQPFELFTHAAD